jgi:hypothetical protein
MHDVETVVAVAAAIVTDVYAISMQQPEPLDLRAFRFFCSRRRHAGREMALLP